MEQTGILVQVADITALTKIVVHGDFSGELRLDPVPVEALELPLQVCGPVLALALSKTDETDMTAVIEELKTGRQVLVIEYLNNKPQGCFTCFTVDYPKFRAGFITAIGAFPGKRNSYPNADSLELLRRWFKLLKCDVIEGEGSAAISRLWQKIGFKEVSRKVRLKI